MSENDVIQILSQIPAGTYISWFIVFAMIIGVICTAIIKLYKLFESYKEQQTEEDILRESVKKHEDELKIINETLSKIEKILEDQQQSDLKRLRHSIIKSGEEAVYNKEITIRGLKSLEELYEDYHRRKEPDGHIANGYVSTLMEKVRDLPVIGALDENNRDI